MASAPLILFDTFMEVVWDDAVSNDGWVEVDLVEPIPRVITRGWVIQDTPEKITLANSVFDSDKKTVGGTQTIPRGMIVSYRKLKVTDASSKPRHKVHSQPRAEELHREPSKG